MNKQSHTFIMRYKPVDFKILYLPNFKVALKFRIFICLFEQAPVENVINYLNKNNLATYQTLQN